MAKKRTIGILAAIVTADATALRSEFASVDNTIRRSTLKWNKELKDGLKLGFGIAGAQSALGLINGEIQRVIHNVESIPGIDPQAVASIVSARTEFSHLRNTVDGALASTMNFGIMAAKSIGALFAVIHGANPEDIAPALSKLESPDENARAQDDHYDEKLAAARTHLNEVRRAGLVLGTTEVNQINELRAQAEKYEQFAQSASITSVQQLEAKAKAQELFNQAKQKEYDLGQKSNQLLEQINVVWHENSLIGKKDAETLNTLNAKRLALMHQISDINNSIIFNGASPEKTQALIDKEKELLQVEKDRGQVLKAQSALYQQIGGEIAGSLENAVLSGGNLRSMLKGIESDLIRIILRTAIIEPLGKAIGGSSVLAGIGKIFGFAEGGRPPVGRASIVGERGPELFVPDSAGTIVPNGGMQGSGGGNKNFYIDARGADRTGLARLEAMIRGIDGSIENRAIGAVMDYRRRGAAA